jgi:hypothetical protein
MSALDFVLCVWSIQSEFMALLLVLFFQICGSSRFISESSSSFLIAIFLDKILSHVHILTSLLNYGAQRLRTALSLRGSPD